MDYLHMPAFRPWIGERYCTEGYEGVRLLIVGEAQYAGNFAGEGPQRGGERPDDTSSTEGLVRDLGIKGPEKHRPFWTKVAKVVLGRSRGEALTSHDREGFWNRVAFYNYIQWWMPKARSRPTNAMWVEAKGPFRHTVDELEPHLIIALGFELHKRLRSIPIGPSDTDLVRIRHPSSMGFSYFEWSGEIRRTIDAAKERLRSCGQI
jgi:hypothetical protein